MPSTKIPTSPPSKPHAKISWDRSPTSVNTPQPSSLVSMFNAAIDGHPDDSSNSSYGGQGPDVQKVKRETRYVYLSIHLFLGCRGNIITNHSVVTHQRSAAMSVERL